MKAAILVLSPKECINLFNGDLSVLVRKKFSKDYVGWVYVYCAKKAPYGVISIKWAGEHNMLGKVVARFWCNKVEEIRYGRLKDLTFGYFIGENTLDNFIELSKKSCLECWELDNYLQDKNGYAIHIIKLEIFDEPEEISEFYWYRKQWVDCGMDCPPYVDEVKHTLTHAPRSGWCYTEI